MDEKTKNAIYEIGKAKDILMSVRKYLTEKNIKKIEKLISQLEILQAKLRL